MADDESSWPGYRGDDEGYRGESDGYTQEDYPGISTIISQVLDEVVSQIVSPLYRGILYLGIVAAGAITAFFMGSDQQLGVSEGSWPGIADLPMWGASITIDVLQPIAEVPLTIIREINGIFVSTVAELGVAAPIAMLFIGAIEIVVLGWLLLRIAELLQVESVVKTLLGPAKTAWGLIR